eukprot:TCALIF_13928-PA protein Name:"Similar to lgals3bpb Galectin-3-binding protein B (Danio rerio)" AED:0.37 eAED:0.37 QI:0/0/0/0.25/1/1/4/0/226
MLVLANIVSTRMYLKTVFTPFVRSSVKVLCPLKKNQLTFINEQSILVLVLAMMQFENMIVEQIGTTFNVTQNENNHETLEESKSEIDMLIDVLETLENEVEPEELSSSTGQSPKEGELRLVNGRTTHEGNIQIFHMGEWGSICDDEWDAVEAKIACKELGFPGAIGPTHSSQFGYSLKRIWMDNMYCYGTETSITDCRNHGKLNNAVSKLDQGAFPVLTGKIVPKY